MGQVKNHGPKSGRDYQCQLGSSLDQPPQLGSENFFKFNGQKFCKVKNVEIFYCGVDGTPRWGQSPSLVYKATNYGLFKTISRNLPSNLNFFSIKSYFCLKLMKSHIENKKSLMNRSILIFISNVLKSHQRVFPLIN